MQESKGDERPYSLMLEAYANSMYLRKGNDNSSAILEAGEDIWTRMEAAGILPANHSFHSRLRMYAEAMRLNRVIELKAEMKSKYGLSPTTLTYNCIIRMFGRAHRVERAFDQFNMMVAADKLEPDRQTYVELVVACTKQFYVQSGMKLLREMQGKNMLATAANEQWINDFRRQLVKFPWMIREIDEMTGKADIPIAPWRHPGVKRKIRYGRELTPEEEKRSPLYR